jgi:hypothetical protein
VCLWLRSPFAAKLGVVSGLAPTRGSSLGSVDLSRHTSLRHYGAIKGGEEPDLADPQLWSPVRLAVALPACACHADMPHPIPWHRLCFR